MAQKCPGESNKRNTGLQYAQKLHNKCPEHGSNTGEYMSRVFVDMSKLVYLCTNPKWRADAAILETRAERKSIYFDKNDQNFYFRLC